jgi:hypothetical protein
MPELMIGSLSLFMNLASVDGDAVLAFSSDVRSTPGRNP